MTEKSNKKPADKKPTIGIIGMGPVGMILAVHLQKAGCDVILCDRDKIKMNAVKREGIKLEGVIEEQAFFTKICNTISDFSEYNPDLLMIAVKSHQTAALLDDLAQLPLNDLLFVSVQNGIDSEKILTEKFGESRVLRMVINFAGNLNASNIVKVTFFNPPNFLSSIDDSKLDVVQKLSILLDQVGLNTKPIDSFELIRRVWEKTILNSSLSALCGIGKFTIKEAMEFPDTVEIIEQVIEEAVEVAEKEKIKFEDDFIRKCLRYLKKAGNHLPSLAVDIINNRPTEIDFLNGKVVEYGRKHYIRTSLNLVFTNLVKAMNHKNLAMQLGHYKKSLIDNREKGLNVEFKKKNKLSVVTDCFLGVDLGSAYTKFTIIDDNENVIHQSLLPSINREKVALKHVVAALYNEYPIKYCCATGYGRKNFHDADITKTEINCAAFGLAKYFDGAKNILDIGGEDIKLIRCDQNNNVENFYLNDKCAAGTGAFLVEIAERAGVSVGEMSDLAVKSNFNKELNSFCTVFAKTEIMGWLFEGLPIEDISKGIYLSITNRIAKMRVDPSLPIYMIGGVISHHPFIASILKEKFKKDVFIAEQPQYIVSLGAARSARQQYVKDKEKNKNKTDFVASK